MTLRLLIGIDPGVNGAIALMADGEPSSVYDMPTKPRPNGGNEVDAFALSDLLSRIVMANVGSHIYAVIEATSMRPGNARGTDSKSAEGAGIVKGVLAAYGVHWTQVVPQVWKRHQGLLKKDKNASRQVALMKWPRHGIHFARVMDHDRAEAMLMAQWGNDTECWIEKAARKVRVARKKPKVKAQAAQGGLL